MLAVLSKILINHTAYKSNYSLVKHIVHNYNNGRLSTEWYYYKNPQEVIMYFNGVKILTLITEDKKLNDFSIMFHIKKATSEHWYFIFIKELLGAK